MHEDRHHVEEEGEHGQDHDRLEIEREDIFYQAEVQAEEVLPNLPKSFDELDAEHQLDRVNVQHVGVPWLNLEELLLQLWARNTVLVSVSLWPTHPVGLHVGVKGELLGLEIDVKAGDKYSDYCKHGDVVVAL